MALNSQLLAASFVIILLIIPLNMAGPLRSKRDAVQSFTGGFNAAHIIYGGGAFDLSGFEAGGKGPVGDGTIIAYDNGFFIKTGTYFNKDSFKQLALLIKNQIKKPSSTK